MEPPWSDGVYARDVPREFEELRIREERKERISLYWDFLGADQEPKVNKQALLHLMKDLKDEGNILFKETNYDTAWMHYRNALFIAKILETRFYHKVDQEFLSTLFSNRAFCCLKKEMYNEAIQDCESAIQIYNGNIKAYYRQVLAMKAQKRFSDALKSAEKGAQIKPVVFKDLIEELKELVDRNKRSTEVSAKDGRSVQKDMPDSDWLAGTNVNVTKQSEALRSKMPKKNKAKNKQQNNNSRSQPVQVAPTTSSTNGGFSSESMSDSDESEDRLSEDEKFANTFINVRKTNLPRSGMEFQTKVQTKEETKQPPKRDNSMGLDSFLPSPGRGSVVTGSITTPTPPRQKNPPNKAPPTQNYGVSNEIQNVRFPLIENYDFKLACTKCFVRIGEGVKGFKYVNAEHPCDKDVFIVKLKNKPVNWIKVRMRPETKFQQFGGYKICNHFQNCQPCKVGEERCTFAHNRAEMELWTMDREGSFNLANFVTRIRELNIANSDVLLSLQHPQPLSAGPKTPVEIPGLNYKSPKPQPDSGNRNMETSFEPVQHTLGAMRNNFSKPPLLHNPQAQVLPNISQLAPHSNLPPMNKPNMSMPMPPSSYGYLPPTSIGFMRTHPPPPFDGFPPGMPPMQRFPPPNNMRNRHPMPNQPFSPRFGAPNMQTQIRPNMMRAPAPRPVTERYSESPSDSQPLSKLEFPLQATHEYKLVCKNCFRYGNYPGQYNYQPITHKCEENILVVRPRQSTIWRRIRERKNHREFKGRYIICNSIYHGNPEFCRYGEENCSFAHNEDEQRLWTLEKDEQFNITEFVIQSRSHSLTRGFTLRDFLSKHSGYFSFICKACFYNVPQMINREGGGDKCSGPAKHLWVDFKILAHFTMDGKVTIVNPRGFLHKTAFFKICKWLHFCRNRINADCRFAHSMIERDVWMLERDTGMTQEDIVLESNTSRGIPVPGSENKSVASDTTSASSSAKSVNMGMSAPKKSFPPTINLDRQLSSEDEMCPFIVQELCLTCWKNGKKSSQDGDRDRCVKGHSNWSTNRVYLLTPSNKEIRPLPRRIPAGYHFIVCKYIREKSKCGYTGGGPCQFAHSEEELQLWQWMCAHDISRLEDLFKVSKEAQKVRAAQNKNKIMGGETVVSVTKSVTLPTHLKFSPHYCSYCGKQCNSQKQWEEHCASEKHNFNVNSDKEHQWNYRQPPWGLPGTCYELCYKNANGNKCQFSNVPDMYNLCQYAHSEEELDEWKERFEWRQMKREMARQEKVFSYMDQLLEKYEEADSGITIIAEDKPSVDISCDKKLVIYEEKKNATFLWTFQVNSKSPLKRVALLQNKDRLHFAFQDSELDKSSQIAPGNVFERLNDNEIPCYKVPVQFVGTMFGSFSQWVIFDFGDLPVVVRKLSVEVGNVHTHEKLQSLRQKLQFDHWTSENRQIRRYDDDIDETERKLTNRYKAPASSESVITQHSVLTELNRNNYKHKMHKLLEMEEIRRHQIISSYNLQTKITCASAIQEETHVYARHGELFAKVPLVEYLTEDTDAGKLILTSVRKVLLAPSANCDSVVYEADIVSKENFDYDGRGKEYIYLCLSPRCVKALGLENGTTREVEIQFQMDRMWFCRMHYAVDHLSDTDIVFPDVPKINPLNERQVFKVKSSVLNEDQMQAIQHIVTDRLGYTPPFVMYGPFGTGKTETIAQAVMVLMKEKPDSKILICAQSNSAADLYITKHLDLFLKKQSSNARLRRIYFKDRRVNTVGKQVLLYCKLNSNETSFDLPTYEDVTKHNIVIVTLSSSLLLSNLNLQGYFTHIFVDEAAQALEAETIMPLSLATEKTCIVLAGDHQQISPKVYSTEAKQQKFDMSLLERLYQYYDSFSNKIDQTSPLNILLRYNYRTKMEILRFLSAIFYKGPDKLESRANLPSVLQITPLMFYAVQGVEVQESDSISFYNTSEVQEVVERVQDLYYNWPEEWGERNARDIGVVTPYYDQVQLIRKALRKKHSDLGKVTVERVNNVQGKEFRALFISTVRTRSLIDTIDNKKEQESEGDGGDYGFLSDSKLLNTAFTRAQSLVAIIGDPVALCAIGDCINVWRTYLRHCQNMNSIRPTTLTLDSIKSQVSNLLNSPARERLQQISNQNRQPSPKSDLPTPQAQNQQKNPWSKKGADDSSPTKNHVEAYRRSAETYIGDSEINHVVESNVILQQLARLTDLGTEKSNSVNGRADEAVRLDCIQIQEEDGYAVLGYTPGVSANSDDDDDVTGKVYTEKELKIMLKSQPSTYKLCTFRYNSQSEVYGEVQDQESTIDAIHISNHQRCGQALDGDEVVMEILQDEDDTDMDITEVVQGCVVGVLRHAIDPSYRSFVCTAEADNTGILTPINGRIRPFCNLITKHQLQNASQGYVCVYKITEQKDVTVSHYVKVDPSNSQDKLFIVRFVKWEPQISFPLGLVVGVIPAEMRVDAGIHVLHTDSQIPTKFTPDTQNIVEFLYSDNYKTDPQEYQRRYDIRDKWTFSIGAEGASHIENALSIEEMSDGSYMIGLHTADVAYYVKKDSKIDVEAKSRGQSLYPQNNDIIPLLPDRLGMDLCSLQPNTDKLTLSIFMTVSKTGEITQVQPKRCIINSKQQYSYEEVEVILQDQNAASDYLKSCLIVLYHISKMWRTQRLGNGSMYLDLENQDKMAPEAHVMLQELFITTNHQVAILLLKCFPDLTPLYCQESPGIASLEQWRQGHAADAINSLALTKPFLDGFKTCTCKVACLCIVNYIRRNDIRVNESFDIYQGLWHAACEAAEGGNDSFVHNIIVSAENHPQLAVALMKLMSIQKKSKYICSADTRNGRHYSLNVSSCVHFTSPVHRYIDIIAHRLVISALEKQAVDYKITDIQQLCSDSTRVEIMSQGYQTNVYHLSLASAIRSKPLVLYPVIEKIDDQGIILCFPSVKDIPISKRKIPLSWLNPKQKIFQLDHNQSVQLTWQERVYDLIGKCKDEVNSNGIMEINPYQFVCKMPSFHWQKLLIAIREENHQKLLTSVQSAKEQVRNPALNQNYTNEITAERRVNGRVKQYVEFTIKLNSCTALQAQLSSELHKGLLTPTIQILNLTPNYSICLEHRASPVSCFTVVTESCSSQAVYQDVETYQNAWSNVLDIEAAHLAVSDADSVVVQNVLLSWSQEHTSNGHIMHTAVFSIPADFCVERQIKCSSKMKFEELFAPTNLHLKNSFFSDFMCVRYSNLNLPLTDATLDKSIAVLFSSMTSWIGHCVILDVQMKGTKLIFKIQLRQSCVPLPELLLDPSVRVPPCTLEWIFKTPDSQKMDYSLRCLSDSSQLAKDIALGRNPVQNVDYRDVEILRQIPVLGLLPPNPDQDNAITVAMKQLFTLIQGPPGSGKSMTGVRLAYMLTLRNKTVPTSGVKPQVLFCAPSNKALDVICGYLKCLGGTCPKVVRVYSDEVEQLEFPLPRTSTKRLKQPEEDVVCPDLEDIALHHLIRRPNSYFGQAISQFDMSFHLYPEDIPDQQIEEYIATVAKAEAIEIQEADIILTTCCASGGSRMSSHTNISQIIIDECGMCTEPETMIPVTIFQHVKQVVLIGDHNQLDPPLCSHIAKNLGLGKSLFERYSDKALMLTTQYRMHEGIMNFPSNCWYNGSIRCGKEKQKSVPPLDIWQSGRERPVVFCNLIGNEEAVTMARSGEQSYCNQEEVNLAVSIASKLIIKHKVGERSIAIISPYQAHCSAITKKLNQKGHKDVNVKTISNSQGCEWEYVILTTVRSLPRYKIERTCTPTWKDQNLGTTCNDHHINVAITRAISGLIIIGNKHLLSCHVTWKNLLQDYNSHGKVVESRDYLRLIT